MSPVTGADLLRALGSGVRPAGVEAGGANAGSVDFASLLRSAQSGGVASGLPVSIDPSMGVELDASGHERLSAAVDRLQAAGADRGVVLIDGHALVVDVASRSALGVVEASEAPLRVDGVVQAAGPDEDLSEQTGRPADPMWNLSNDGLGRLLAG